MQELRQSTAIYVQLGPYLDSTDGNTPETGLTISQADVRLSKNGAVFAQKNDANAAVHDEVGWYRCQLNATDTGTLGRLLVAIHESGSLVVWREFMVVTANYWDSKYSTDYRQVDAMQIEGTDATNQINAACDTALTDYDAPTNAEMNARTILAASYFDPSADAVANVTTVATTTTNTDVRGTDSAALASVCTETRLAELDAANLPSDVDAILTDTNDLQTDWVNGGRLDLILDIIAADTTTDIPALIGALNDLDAAAVGDAVLDEVVEGAETLRGMARGLRSVLAGETAGGGTETNTFFDATGLLARITATVDASGNRTAVSVDWS